MWNSGADFELECTSQIGDNSYDSDCHATVNDRRTFYVYQILVLRPRYGFHGDLRCRDVVLRMFNEIKQQSSLCYSRMV